MVLVEGLLRWRIPPEVYERVGIHFNDYPQLPFAARRRRIFQYARAAMEIETARLLAARRSEWSGTLVMIGQPAEEIGSGAVGWDAHLNALAEAGVDGMFADVPEDETYKMVAGNAIAFFHLDTD